VIDKCCETVDSLAHARHVELIRELPAGGMMVRAEHGRMRQVTVALLSNCIPWSAAADGYMYSFPSPPRRSPCY
jgi:C4-dicarboxylate-specific signal transduction histidine kinase